MTAPLTSHPRPVRPNSPHLIWRETCWVTDQMAVSGDLPFNRTAALQQIARWETEGITDVFDMRGECDDTHFIHENSCIRSHWFGVDDNGGPRDDAWFRALTQRALEILSDPERRILVHCHMGVNRGPSALYAILLACGWDHLDALRGIRDARPIAGIIYAPDAARWFATESGLDTDTGDVMVTEVQDWLRRNNLDLGYVIRSIGNREATRP